MIVFDIIRYKNILSTGAAFTEIKLSDSSNTLIIGENGSGKSTFLDALTFVLFGKAFRNINKPQLVSTITEKNCLIEIEFTVGKKSYKVIRGIKPNIFEIWCDGIFINQDSSSKDYQEYLEKFILKMNYKSFTQIVVLGSADFTPFMKLTPADRRLVIEDLLDIQVFSIMNVVVKNKLQENKSAIETNNIEIQAKAEKKLYIEKSLESLNKNYQERLNKLELQKASLVGKIKDLDLRIVDLCKLIDDVKDNTKDLAKLRKKHSKLLMYMSKIENNLSRAKDEVSFLEEHRDCPTCKQTIQEEFRLTEITKLSEKVRTFSDGIESIEQDIQQCLSDIQTKENLEKTRIQHESDAKSLKLEKSITQKQIDDLDSEIRDLYVNDNLTTLSKTELIDVGVELSGLEDKKKELLNEKLVISTALGLLKDGGIKTKIIKQYLPIINQQINKYLLQMGFFVNFSINESFEETIKSRYRDTFSYENFSQGEKQRIDLALLFTWRHIAKMRNSANTNLLIFDEILDGSLDNSGTDEFLKIMWNLSPDTNTFVISHKTDMLLDKFKKVLLFTKKQNFSVMTVR